MNVTNMYMRGKAPSPKRIGGQLLFIKGQWIKTNMPKKEQSGRWEDEKKVYGRA